MGAYRTARTHTDNVYLIENHAFGTTCARVSCMPSKLLIADDASNQLPLLHEASDQARRWS